MAQTPTETTSPHGLSARAGILDSICDAVGWTPMVRLSRIGKHLPCELLAKCEFMNPGGSVKDRIGVRMIRDAEQQGRIKPGDTLIEPTSGNTGIGMSMAAAVQGYRMLITMPEKMSREKQVVLEALGAEIIRTPTEAAYDAPESHIGVASQLREILPDAHILNQYGNPSNPTAHYEGTAQEILAQCDGKLDAVVMTAGTGGTISGVAKGLKEALPAIQVIGVDPEGSILAGPAPVKSYKVEGIGYDFIPDVLDRELVDTWVKSNDRDSFRTARQLIRQEGLLVGGSCGAAVWAAMQVCKKMKAGQRVVVLLPDSIRNYMTKFADDQWMRRHGFAENDWAFSRIGDVLRALPKREVVTARAEATLSDVVQSFKSHGISQMPVEQEGRVVGILTESDVLHALVESKASMRSSVAEMMNRNVVTVQEHTPSSELTDLFGRDEVAIVVDDEQRIKGLITKLDVIDLLAKQPSTSNVA